MTNPITFTSRDIQFIRIKRRKYRKVFMKFKPKNGNLSFQVNYSTYGESPLFGQIFDSMFMTSKRFKFFPRERKMVYIIPFFEDQLTKRLNRNVRAEFIFEHDGWSKLMNYITTFMKNNS